MVDEVVRRCGEALEKRVCLREFALLNAFREAGQDGEREQTHEKRTEVEEQLDFELKVGHQVEVALQFFSIEKLSFCHLISFDLRIFSSTLICVLHSV